MIKNTNETKSGRYTASRNSSYANKAISPTNGRNQRLIGILLQKSVEQIFLTVEQIFFAIIEKHDTEHVQILQNRRHHDTHIYIRMM